jgi:serine/threonine-protein kinase
MADGVASASVFHGGEGIGHYRVLGLLGAGGMGVVYKALDLQLGRTVALKFLPTTNSGENETQQLLNEARAASQLDHTNIGVVHGIEQTDDGQWFIVMAFYDGVTLERKIGSLLTTQALEIAAQVARGLAEAHAHNIIHRDIKPSNIILAANGTAKIVDFGIARLTPTASETISAGAKGTTTYMSPEQILGTAVDQRSDIWSLGVVLAQMLSGKYPFTGDNIGAKVYAILNDAPLPLEGIPASVQAIVYKALAKNAADRYQTCAELLGDLEQAQRLLSPASPTAENISALASLAEAQRKKASTPVAGQKQVPSSRSWRLRVAILLIGVLLGVLAIPSIYDRVRNRWFGEKEKHIAVLPFDVIGNDPQIAPLADGLMDSFTSKLSNLDEGQQSFWVVPSSVVRRQKVDDPRAALRDLGATLVVKGSIQRAGSTTHLIVNLISTRQMRQVASADLEDSSGDFAFLQEQAIQQLLRVINVATGTAVVLAGETTGVPGVYEAYVKALGYMQRYDKPGNLDSAIQELTGATERDSRFALGFAQLAEAYRLKYKLEKDPQWTDKALTTCKKALAINDKIPTAWVTWGRIHTDTGKYELAMQEFQKALDLNPRSADAVIGLARAYEAAGKLPDAEATFKKAIAMRPDYWDGYNSLAVFYYRQNRYMDAVQQLKHAAELTPDNSAIYVNLAAMYLNMDDSVYRADAERALKKSIELAPTYSAYTNLGFLYLKQRQWSESAATTEKAAALNPNESQIWENLGVAYEWLGDSSKAIYARQRELDLVEKAAAVNPRDAEVQGALASLYARKHDVTRTTQAIERSLTLAPNNREVLFDVGEAYEILGQRQKAISYLNKSLANGYTLADLQRASTLKDLLADPNFIYRGSKQ